MCVINWIRYMGGWMTWWHTSFIRRKKNKEIDEKKKWFKKWYSLWTNNQYLQIGCQLKGKTWKTIDVDFKKKFKS